ncbi:MULTISPECIES: hypothetical protein [Pseudomonas fluorescens group]
MRVPVYPEDLLPQAAFKKLAKIIQKRWPGQSSVQLSFARETLSKGLGYANYHDLMKESVIWPRDAETPALSTTHSQLAAEIFSVLALANDTSGYITWGGESAMKSFQGCTAISGRPKKSARG